MNDMEADGLLPFTLKIDKEIRSNDVYRKCLIIAFGIFCPVILPLIHISITYKLFGHYSRHVDVDSCICSCWDRVFKGTYEAGVTTYKHVYFNATSNTFKIWIITVIAILLAYECGRYVCGLLINRNLRWKMLVLLISIVYPHYYSYWVYFNYWNDEFYSQWYHQLYFTLTELLSTVVVLMLANKKRPMRVAFLLIILDVAVAHIVISSFDQLVTNVVRGEGNLNQITRDMGFFFPDVLHVMVALSELVLLSKTKHLHVTYLISNREFIFSVLFVVGSWLLCFLM